MSSTWIVLPSSLGSKKSAFISIRSMTPRNGVVLSLGEPLPIGTTIGTGAPSSRSVISATAVKKFAPTTSILLMKTRRGTW